MVAEHGQRDPGRQAPLIGAARAPDLHVMSYNLRSATGGSPHSWAVRRPLVAALVRRERPSVLCTQEGRFRQLRELRADLTGYDWVHLGRGGGSRSEATAILWDQERLVPLEYDHLWLSRRPHSIGSRSWGSRTVRMLTWVRFEDRDTGRDFYVVDNHLDHRSERARRKGAKLNLKVLAEFGAPAIVAGDFNCGSGSAVHGIFTAAGLGDSWDTAAERLTPAWGTFNRWRAVPVEGGRRIDWILAESGFEVRSVAVNPWSRDGVPPSDHWPVQALVRLR